MNNRIAFLGVQKKKKKSSLTESSLVLTEQTGTQVEISIPPLKQAVSAPSGFNRSKPGGQVCHAARLETAGKKTSLCTSVELRLKTKKYPATKGKGKPQKGGQHHSPPGVILGQERTGSTERLQWKGQGGNFGTTRGRVRGTSRDR